MKEFLEVEGFLKQYYGFDRNTIKTDISDSVDIAKASNDPNREKYRIKEDSPHPYYDHFAYAMDNLSEFYISVPDLYNDYLTTKFCEDYDIKTNTYVHLILELIYAILQKGQKTDKSESEIEKMLAEDYALYIRPQMLQFYIAMKKSSAQAPCKISFGNSEPIVIDTAWFNRAMDEYLHKYLGVDSLEEAEQEYKTNYDEYAKVGAKLNEQAARYMWGTYFLLQLIPQYKSKKERSVTNKQSRIIADLLLRIGILKKKERSKYEDGQIIRGQLNYYLKTYDTVNDFLNSPKKYKASPYNKSGRLY